MLSASKGPGKSRITQRENAEERKEVTQDYALKNKNTESQGRKQTLRSQGNEAKRYRRTQEFRENERKIAA